MISRERVRHTRSVGSSERPETVYAAGVNLLLLQSSPQLEEMERFADTVIRAV